MPQVPPTCDIVGDRRANTDRGVGRTTITIEAQHSPAGSSHSASRSQSDFTDEEDGSQGEHPPRRQSKVSIRTPNSDSLSGYSDPSDQSWEEIEARGSDIA